MATFAFIVGALLVCLATTRSPIGFIFAFVGLLIIWINS